MTFGHLMHLKPARKYLAAAAVVAALAALPSAASAGSIAMPVPAQMVTYSASTAPANATFTTSGVLSGTVECSFSAPGQAPTGWLDCTTPGVFNGESFEVSTHLFDWTADFRGGAGVEEDGEWTFAVRATLDGVPLTVTRTFEVDTHGPDLGWTAPATNAVYPSTVPSVAISPSDPSPNNGVTTLECRYNANAFVDCGDSSISAPGLANGSHTMSVRAVDGVGNETVETRTFRLDTIAPFVSLIEVASPSNDNTPTFDFAVNDINPSLSQCSVAPFGAPEPAYGPCGSSSSYSPGPLTDGQWVARVRHTDEAGNTGFAIDSFTIDTVSPVITIASPLPNQVLETSVPELDISAADPDPGTGVASYSCAYDGAPLVPCGDESFANRRLGDGAHSLTVQAADNTGNVSTSTVQFSVNSSIGAAPPAARSTTLKRISKKVKRGKLRLRVRLTIQLANGVDPVVACTGKARIKVTGKLRKKRARSFTKRVALKRSGSTCVATTTFALPKAYKRGFLKGVAVVQGNGSLAAGTARARL